MRRAKERRRSRTEKEIANRSPREVENLNAQFNAAGKDKKAEFKCECAIKSSSCACIWASSHGR
eukprot:6008339-Pleurochrysis_carterae.AAC.1